MDIILASSNSGKIKEFKDILSPLGINIISLKDLGFNKEIIEDGNSFKENAIIKAKTIYDEYRLPVISDDSGLCCLGLDLAPGIYSARYKGLKTDIARRNEILKELVDSNNRGAYFYCSLIFYVNSDEYYEFSGKVDGFILKEERGVNGFGYDPIFSSDNIKSFAEISDIEKNKISHRGIAVSKFVEFIKNGFNSK